MPSDKIRRIRIVRGSKRSRVPIKSALKRERWRRRRKVSLQCRIRYARQIFARLESFWQGTMRQSARAPSACRLRQGRASARRVVWRAGRYQGFRTDPARQEYSIEKSKNSADDPGRGQDQCAKKKRVLSCDFQHGIDSFHGIAQIV